MRRFKKAEFWINLTLFCCLAVWCIIKRNEEVLIRALFLMSWLQASGMIIHELRKWFTDAGELRNTWHRLVLFSMLLLPLGHFNVLLYLAPEITSFYIYLCYREVFIKMRRPLSLLK